MRASLFGLLWAGVTVVATPCKPATPSSSSVSSSSAAPSASPSTVCTDAAILNPAFAFGLDSWSTSIYSDGTFTVTASTDCGTDVSSCAELYSQAGQAGASGDASVFQSSIPVTDGVTYTLSYEYRITASGSGIMGVFVNGLATAGGAAGTLNQWATYSILVTASGSTISIAPFQRSYGGSMTIQITNVKLETCTSPGGSSGVTGPTGP